jgi:hypothetical protein
MNCEIEKLLIDEVRSSYSKISGASAPRNVSLKLLKRAVYWHIRCIQYSVPKNQAAIHKSSGDPRLKAIGLGIPGGSILLKEWRGTVHEVHTTKDSRYVYNGKEFSSLSAIACSITGCKRSGPRFFGLTNSG